jgi:hypothetical protein
MLRCDTLVIGGRTGMAWADVAMNTTMETAIEREMFIGLLLLTSVTDLGRHLFREAFGN